MEESGAAITLRLNSAEVLGLAALGVALGMWVKRRAPILDRLNIPASIVGGLLYAALFLALRGRVDFAPDLALRDLFQIAFFTTIGLSASLRLIRAGGLPVLWFWALATFGALLQNALGIGLVRLFGLDPLLGVIAGSAALAGGPATTLAFGPTFEKLGVAGATTLGLASATFGITVAGLAAGWMGGRLIRRHGLKPQTGAVGEPPPEIRDSPLLVNVLAVAVAMGLGAFVSAGIERLGVVLPAYIGAMVVAAALRNLDDRWGWLGLGPRQVASIGAVSLYLFIVIALIGLRLWELAHLALPMLAVLAAQVALMWLLSVALSFRAMGRDYESAVMASGYCGFMLGITANALASMEELARKFGPAPRAFVVVPLVGGFLIDFTNALLITVCANLLR